MYEVGEYVQIINHSEPSCNMAYGNVKEIVYAYDGTRYYTVVLEDMDMVCTCTDDELMEG
jgi:hypothetical protein